MELILDDDDHMQFYPALGDIEAAVLHVVSAVSGTMQNVPTVQVTKINVKENLLVKIILGDGLNLFFPIGRVFSNAVNLEDL